MTKNLKLTFILYAVFFAIIMAWNTLSQFFFGAGLNFVALLVILAVILIMYLTDKFVASRTRDLFYSIIAFAVLEFLVYFVFEFGIGSYKTWEGFANFQNILTFFAILFFAYLVFKVICEIKGLRFGIIEFILGNSKKSPKQKKAKELSNGSLEDKPNHANNESHTMPTYDENVIVENENHEE